MRITTMLSISVVRRVATATRTSAESESLPAARASDDDQRLQAIASAWSRLLRCCVALLVLPFVSGCWQDNRSIDRSAASPRLVRCLGIQKVKPLQFPPTAAWSRVRADRARD